MLFQYGFLQYLICTWPLLGILPQHTSNELTQIIGVTRRHWIENARLYLLIQPLQVIRLEWWWKRCHLIQNTSKRPYIALGVIRQVIPHLWTGIVRCSRLRMGELLFEHFGNVEIPDLECAVFADKYIGGFQIPVEDLFVVQGLEAFGDVINSFPNLSFLKPATAL